MTLSVTPRFSVWILVLVILISSLLYMWKRVEPNTVETAYALAARRILDKANYYRESWHLRKQADELVIDGKAVRFSPEGWALPLSDGQVDCHYWLTLLYPEEKIFGQGFEQVVDESSAAGHACTYRFKDGNAIALRLQNRRFTVSVDFSSL